MAQTSAARGSRTEASPRTASTRVVRRARPIRRSRRSRRVSARDRPCDWAIVPSRMSKVIPQLDRWHWIWHWVSAAYRKGRIVEIYGPESSGKTTTSWRCMWWPTPRKTVASPRSSTRNTRWILFTRRIWASMSAVFWFLNRIPENRHWRFVICWCAAARWTLLSSTLSPHWFRKLRFREKWATAMSVCRPD